MDDHNNLPASTVAFNTMATRTQDHAKAPQASTDASLDTSQENSLHDEPAPVVAQPETAPPVSPDGGYGWVCCFAVFLINAHSKLLSCSKE